MEGNCQERDYGRLENIQAKLNRMRQEAMQPGAQDVQFTNFLAQMQNMLDQQVWSAAGLEQEIDRNYQIYLNRRRAQTENQQQPMSQQQPIPQQQPMPQPMTYQPPKKRTVWNFKSVQACSA